MSKVIHTCTGCVPIDKSIIDVYVALLSADKSVTEAETARVEAENARVAAETARDLAESSRKSAEDARETTSSADHATAIEDHAVAEADHTTAEADHDTATSDHTSSVEATEAAGTATARANAAAAAAEHMVDIKQGPKGDQGNTGSSIDYPYELVNNVTTDDATKGLSAAQGVVLDGKISQLGQEINGGYNYKEGYYLNASGEEVADPDYCLSELIILSADAKTNGIYWSYGTYRNDVFLFIYDIDGNIIDYFPGVSGASSRKITANNLTANAYSIRIPFSTNFIGQVDVAVDPHIVLWEARNLEGIVDRLEGEIADVDDRVDTTNDRIDATNEDVNDISEQINGSPNYKQGYYLDSNGDEVADPDYCVSELIVLTDAAKENGIYWYYGTYRNNIFLFIYDENGNVVDYYPGVNGASSRKVSAASLGVNPHSVKITFSTNYTGKVEVAVDPHILLWSAGIAGGVIADLNGLSNEIQDIKEYIGYEPDSREIIPLAYLTNVASSAETITDAATYLNNGEYALIIADTLIYKDGEGNVEVVENTVDGVSQYRYQYCGKVGEIRRAGGKNWLYFTPDALPDSSMALEVNGSDNETVEYDIADWPFYVQNADGIYPQLFLCYAFMDDLVRRYPDYITKYDPMATASYTEDGITIQPLTSVRSKLVAAGFSDWPVYMQGIETAGEYTFNGYTKNLLPTPAYKTFIYFIQDVRIDFGWKTGNKKRKFFIQAGIHPAEVISQISACLFVENLLSNNKNSYNLLSNYEFWVIPCLEGYGGMHGDSWTAAGINANRNYVTRWWKYNSAQIYNSGLVAGDQFSTRLSMAMMDYLNPDIFLDLHTLNDTVTVPSSSNITMEFVTSTNSELCKYAAQAAAVVMSDIQKMYPEIFGNVSPKPEVGFDYQNSATGRSYMAQKHNNSTIALVEVQNTLNANPALVNSSEALTVSANFIRNIIYALVRYNLEHCKQL